MTSPIPTWTRADQNKAVNEGWLIDTWSRTNELPEGEYTDQQKFQIQRADIHERMTDEEARTHVKRLADQGSEFHKKAQLFVIMSRFIPFKEMHSLWRTDD